jgi:ankyrin repeat protein
VTPLHQALQTSTRSIQSIIDKGVNINIIDYVKNTFLHYAIKLGNIDAVQILLRNDPDLDAKNDDSLTPLQYAESINSNSVTFILNATPKQPKTKTTKHRR